MAPGTFVMWGTCLCVLAGILAAASLAAADGLGQYTPKCPPVRDPPSKGYRRWSSPKTWAPLPVPGVARAAWRDAVIPCGAAILLDVPLLRLNKLIVRGLLRVEDPRRRRKYSVLARWVVVEGQLSIGSFHNHFKSRIRFLLLHNPAGRKSYTAAFNPPAPVDVGHKAFAVVGGQVLLYGMPGGRASPSWVRLAKSAVRGQSYITVDADVSKLWPVGATIALSSTDYDPHLVDTVTVVAYGPARHGAGVVVHFRPPLSFNHWGNARGIPDGAGGFVDIRAEVGLLSRNIRIVGEFEKSPYGLEGGHMMVYQTQQAQAIYGVEFHNMGQQGRVGRYPLHFHMCGDMQRKTVLWRNSIHYSKQRCIVVHATDNLVVQENVAFDTAGHCFVLEEGGEQRNVLLRNLGMLTRAVAQRISDAESDHQPATFWISNPYNEFVGNVAAGSESSGFWLELKPEVRGLSRGVPSLQGIHPNHNPLRSFQGNTMHSNTLAGLRTYPGGYYPSRPANFSRFLVYKHRTDGLLLQTVTNVLVTQSTFADNMNGVHIVGNSMASVLYSRFVGLSANVGTPPMEGTCRGAHGATTCAPISGCTFPPRRGNIRRNFAAHWLLPSFGVAVGVFTAGASWKFVHRCIFSGYAPRCKPAAGIGFGIDTTSMPPWSTSYSVSGVKWNTRDGTIPLWLAPSGYKLADGSVLAGGLSADQYAVHDTDGSIVGRSSGGFLVRASPFLSAPANSGRAPCRLLASSQALACPGACFRSVKVSFAEEGGKPGHLSTLVITRVDDGNVESLSGNQNGDYLRGAMIRWFRFTVFAPARYKIVVVPPDKSPSIKLMAGALMYTDDSSCKDVVGIEVVGQEFKWQ